MSSVLFKILAAICGVPVLSRDSRGNASLSIDGNDADIKLGKGLATPITGSRALTADDDGTTLVNLTTSAYILTVPLGLPAGFGCRVIQGTTGLVTMAASGGAAITGLVGLKTNGAHSVANVVQTAADVYVYTGDTAA